MDSVSSLPGIAIDLRAPGTVRLPKGLSRAILKYFFFYLLALPGMAYFLVFH